MLFRQMGDSDKTHKQQHNDWNDTTHSSGPGAYGAPSTSSVSTLAHANHSWLAPTHASFSTFPNHGPAAPVTTSLPQAPRYPAITSHPVTSGYPTLPSYQAWSGYDFTNSPEQHAHHQRPSQEYHMETVQSHCMSAPTTPMTEDGPHMSSYVQGHQHPYAVSPSYATLTDRRDTTQRNHDPLHHQSPEQYEYERHQFQQSWDHPSSSYHHQEHGSIEAHSPSSHEDHFYPNQDDEYRKSSSASGMPIFSHNNTSPPPMTAYQYSPELGEDGTPSPISNSYPATSSDYLSYHDDENPKHSRRYSIGGGMITSAPHNTSMPSYPPYMKAYHYKVPLTERPYKCDKCPQSFNRNHDLKRHKRIHLSVKPFPCQTCDKQFSRKDALKRHILVKRCGQPLPPDGRRSSNHQNVARSTSGVTNNRNKSGAFDLPDQYANTAMAPPY